MDKYVDRLGTSPTEKVQVAELSTGWLVSEKMYLIWGRCTWVVPELSTGKRYISLTLKSSLSSLRNKCEKREMYLSLLLLLIHKFIYYTWRYE